LIANIYSSDLENLPIITIFGPHKSPRTYLVITFAILPLLLLFPRSFNVSLMTGLDISLLIMGSAFGDHFKLGNH